MESMSKALIEKTLERIFGNQIKAAKILGDKSKYPDVENKENLGLASIDGSILDFSW
ncbi:MAG: helix-turn-helix domain-containing protein [Methanocellales archaeon]|nr:helix-turn-helix domain-containing protein [Methanocellales archaeon]MDD5235567.1 helix-turn-helix domain-containing protein [Methanocellales archaeon]